MDGSVPTNDVPFNPQDDDILELPTLGMIGRSLLMHELRRTICRYAPLPAPILVTGETGTGKELVARALHDASPHKTRPFVAVNAGAIPASLIASELFGHVRGAFTGATGPHRGVFEQAHGGTLFIDEVAELPYDLQAWLLRVLETGEVRPLGAERPRKVEVRVIAATNADLQAAVRERRMRADLYWRLAVLTIRVPPLRDRPDDIVVLAQHFVRALDLPDRYTLTPDALQVLAVHDWPGNVRELRGVILRAVATSVRTNLDAIDMTNAIGEGLAPVPRTPQVPDSMYIALRATHGNVSKAARALGVPRTTLRERLLRAHGTSRPPN